MLGFEMIGTGARRALVLNDWLCDTSTWDPAKPYLDREGFCWAFADLRGYGRSRHMRGLFTLEEATSDALELADSLGWNTFSVVGHSMSTLVALQLAQQHSKRIDRAVLLCPPPPQSLGYDADTLERLVAVAKGDDALRARAIAVMLAGGLPGGWRRFKLDRWRATSDPDAVAGYLPMFGTRGLPDRTTHIACPVLAITGDDDAPPMRSEPARSNLSRLCDELQVVAFAACGHYPMQEMPPRLVGEVERFIAAK